MRYPLFRILLLFGVFFLFGFEIFPILRAQSENRWTPENIPDTDLGEFLLFFQKFTHENPYSKTRHSLKTPEGRAEQREFLRKRAALYARFSEVLSNFSQSDSLASNTPEGIRRDPKDTIAGMRVLNKKVPPNTRDLWEESCFLRFVSLQYESRLDEGKIPLLHEYADQIAKFETLDPLYQDLKRRACLRSLQPVSYRLHKISEQNGERSNESKKESEMETGSLTVSDWKSPADELCDSIKKYADFLQSRAGEQNLRIAESFLDTIGLFQAVAAPESRLSMNEESIEKLRKVFSGIQKNSKIESTRELAEVFSGTLRRMDLLGKEMPVWGTDLQGNSISPESLDGKVVLLDFWATWCGPCIAEFPELKILHEKYHEKGFEIIGFSVDSDLGNLRTYLKKNPLPWTVLSKETTKTSGLPSLSAYYGARKLPVVLLRDHEGKAVLLDARGKNLEKKLEELFSSE